MQNKHSRGGITSQWGKDRLTNGVTITGCLYRKSNQTSTLRHANHIQEDLEPTYVKKNFKTSEGKQRRTS